MTPDIWKVSPPVPTREPPRREHITKYVNGTGRLKSALDAIPNTGEHELNYDAWRDVIFALHFATEGSDIGLALAHEFSARASKYDADFLDNRVWAYVRNEREGAVITERTLFAKAAECGWQDPSTADDFEVVAPLADERKRFEFIHETAFASTKPPEWIVQGVIPDADLAVVYGESGSGKSFFVLDVVQAIARGAEWRGKRVRGGRVAYIAAEGAGGFRNRIAAYKSQHQLDATDLYVLADSPSFLEKAHVNDVIAALKAIGPVSVVVVDTLAQVTPGGAENSSEDMGKVIAHCRAIRKATSALVILIHHAGKDSSKGARGWSGLRAAADCEIEVVRADHERVATITKLKDGEDGAEFGFRLQSVMVGVDEDGEDITSCVVEHVQAVPRAQRRREPKGTNERAVLRAARDCVGLDGGAPYANDVIEAAVGSLQAPADGRRDQRRHHVVRALDGLVVDGVLVRGEGGTVRSVE